MALLPGRSVHRVFHRGRSPRLPTAPGRNLYGDHVDAARAQVRPAPKKKILDIIAVREPGKGVGAGVEWRRSSSGWAPPILLHAAGQFRSRQCSDLVAAHQVAAAHRVVDPIANANPADGPPIEPVEKLTGIGMWPTVHGVADRNADQRAGRGSVLHGGDVRLPACFSVRFTTSAGLTGCLRPDQVPRRAHPRRPLACGHDSPRPDARLASA